MVITILKCKKITYYKSKSVKNLHKSMVGVYTIYKGKYNYEIAEWEKKYMW